MSTKFWVVGRGDRCRLCLGDETKKAGKPIFFRVESDGAFAGDLCPGHLDALLPPTTPQPSATQQTSQPPAARPATPPPNGPAEAKPAPLFAKT